MLALHRHLPAWLAWNLLHEVGTTSVPGRSAAPGSYFLYQSQQILCHPRGQWWQRQSEFSDCPAESLVVDFQSVSTQHWKSDFPENCNLEIEREMWEYKDRLDVSKPNKTLFYWDLLSYLFGKSRLEWGGGGCHCLGRWHWHRRRLIGGFDFCSRGGLERGGWRLVHRRGGFHRWSFNWLVGLIKTAGLRWLLLKGSQLSWLLVDGAGLIGLRETHAASFLLFSKNIGISIEYIMRVPSDVSFIIVKKCRENLLLLQAKFDFIAGWGM